MSSPSRPITTQLIGAVSAANADRLSDPALHGGEPRNVDTAAGWDSYEVWRRFIKDARDRRRRHRD